MNGILQTTLAVLVGVCLYAATYHLWIGLHRPRQRLHLLFAVLSFCVASHVLVKLGSYRAETVVQLVSLRRWEVTLGLVGIGMLPWFALAYTGLRWRALPAMLTLLLAIFLGANLVLPYGVSFIELPSLEHLTLPWGEQVVDLRVHQRSALFNAGWLAMVANFVFAGYVCVHQYRHGQRRPAVRLALALGVFLAFLLFNQAVNVGLVRFTHTAEFGFVALVLLMSAALSRELRASRDALAASETRFRALVEQSPFSIQVLAPDGRTLQVNRAWETLWGSRLEALSGYNVLRDRQLIEKGVMPYLERGFGGEATEIPAIVYNPAATAEVPGGSFRDRWVRAFVYPIKDSAGQVQEVILMHEDITDRKWSEDAIRHIAAGVSARTGEEFFQHLVQHLAALFDADYAFVGLLDTARPGTVTTLAVCAHGAIALNMEYALTDTPCANVVGQNTCAYPSSVQRLFPKDRLLADMGVDGYIGTPLFDTRGEPLGLLVVLSQKPLERIERVREILEIFAARAGAELQRLRAEREIERQHAALEQRVHERTAALAAANQELEAFSYSVSHDLRAPLRAIDGFARALAEEYPGALDDTARDYLRRIRGAAERMGRLIDDLLQLSRVGRAALHPRAVDVSAMATEIVTQLQASIPERRVSLDIVPGISAHADAQLLRIVLTNLLDNAWKYTGKTPQARIEFGRQRRDDVEVFYVRDNGAGFDMRYADKLFGAFQRLHRHEEFPGTGVGLATVQRIIHRHGGRVWAESEVGKGATFFFTLTAPVSAPSADHR